MLHNKGQKINIIVEEKDQSPISKQLTAKSLIKKSLNILKRLNKDCHKQNTIYITKSSYSSLQIALVFCFSKSQSRNTATIKELMTIFRQNQEALTFEQLSLVIDGFIEYITEGQENYDHEEALYLIKYLAPLFYLENNK